MITRKLTTRKIKKTLKIKSWNNIPLDKYDALSKLLIISPKRVVCDVVCKLPNFDKSIKQIVSLLEWLCKKPPLSLNKKYRKNIKKYARILFKMKNQLNKKKISLRRKKKITYKVIEIVDYLMIGENEPRKILTDLVGVIGKIGIVVSGLTLIISFVLKRSLKKGERIKRWKNKLIEQL